MDWWNFRKISSARKKLIREEFCRATVRAGIKWMSDVKFTIYNGREYNGSAARSQLSDNARLRRYLFISSVTVDDAITSEFINLHANARHRFIIPHELKDRSNGQRERERKNIEWFLDRTAATLYSTRHRRNAGREKRGRRRGEGGRWSIARNFINVAIIVSSIASTDILFSVN